MTTIGQSSGSSEARITTGLSSLERLLQYVSDKEPTRSRIDVEIIGQNIFLSRWDKDMATLAYTENSRGHGRGFEQVCTAKNGGSLSNFHRIVSSKLSNLQSVIQHEVDACPGDCFKKFTNRDGGAADFEDPEESFGSHKGREEVRPAQSGLLRVIKPGIRHIFGCLVEVKSRKHTDIETEDVLRKLWPSRSYKLLLDRQVEGRFAEGCITEEDMTAQLQKWQKNNIGVIGSLVKLLRHFGILLWPFRAQELLRGMHVCIKVDQTTTGHIGTVG